MEKAEQVARELGSRRMRWQILALRAEMEQQRGKDELANQLRGEARGLLDFIVEHTPEDLRAGFLGRKDVREIMGIGD